MNKVIRIGAELRNVRGFTAILEPRPDQITTQAFIVCAECGGAISGTGGPRDNSFCVPCTVKIIGEPA